MTYKQIEASREMRLWIGQVIIVPAVLAGTAIASNPATRQTVVNGANNVKNFVTNKVKKMKES